MNGDIKEGLSQEAHIINHSCTVIGGTLKHMENHRHRRPTAYHIPEPIVAHRHNAHDIACNHP